MKSFAFLLAFALAACAVPAMAQTAPATQLGINLNGPAYFAGTRPFMNLAAGGGQTLINTSGQWVAMPADRLDANGNVVTLVGKEQVARSLSPATAAYRGQSVEIVCRWQGKGTVALNSASTSNVKIGANALSYTLNPTGNLSVNFIYRNIDPADPLRAIDCREKDADPNALFDPTFLDELKGYSTVRFLKWTRAVESNINVTWAGRTKPGDGVINGSDSIPIEYMVALANEAKVNPWFTIPWNADADYVRNMAVYVRDHLDPSLQAYVETSNEVWNYVYPVTKQAIAEGKERGIGGGDDFVILLRRYAQKTGEVMDVWSDVYGGQMHRLVRVAATQNGAWQANQILRYGDTAKKIDAIATAPYFNATLKAGVFDDPARLDKFLDVDMRGTVDTRIAEAKAVKDAAAAYGLRYIAYEAGQHLTGDIEANRKAQHHPGMGRLYAYYLDQWKAQIGDLMTLFVDITRIDQYGAFGHREFIGQPLSEAPKAKAIEEWRLANLAPVTPPDPVKSDMDKALDALDAAVAAVRAAAT